MGVQSQLRLARWRSGGLGETWESNTDKDTHRDREKETETQNDTMRETTEKLRETLIYSFIHLLTQQIVIGYQLCLGSADHRRKSLPSMGLTGLVVTAQKHIMSKSHPWEQSGLGNRRIGDTRARPPLSGEGAEVPTRILAAPALPLSPQAGCGSGGNREESAPRSRRDQTAVGKGFRLPPSLPKTPPNPRCWGPSADRESVECSSGGSVER